MLAEAAKRPELSGVTSTYSVNSPRLYVDLDREKARMLNVNVADVFNTMGATLGASYINDFNMNGRTFRVYMQADEPYRSLPDEMGASMYRAATATTFLWSRWSASTTTAARSSSRTSTVFWPQK